MPGGRLSHEDRRYIATALAEGRTYAEIARHLDRPKSTVSREVNRNGGPEGYKADLAHRATTRRARRSKPMPLPSAPDTEQAYGRDPEAVHEFTEHLTELMIQSGMSRMVARVMTCLYTTDSGSLTAAELVAKLHVSPASVSTAIAYLERQALIRRAPGGGRRERYIVDDDVWFRALLATARLNQLIADAARDGGPVFGLDTPAGARLDRFGQFMGSVNNDLLASAEHWRRALFGESGADAMGGRDGG